MGSVLSAWLDEEEKKKVPSGSSNGAGDGQAGTRPGVPTTSAGSGSEKKQGESSSSSPAARSGTEKKQGESSSPPPAPPTTSDWVPFHFSEIVAQELKDGASEERLRDQVSKFKAIYLDGKKKKYWVDERTKANCFMLFARGLFITWGSDTRYWNWSNITTDEMSEARLPPADMEETDVEVAYLKDVCWLEIRGWLDMSQLSPGYIYDVVFVAKLAPGAYGWSVPVDLQLKYSGSGAPPEKTRKENIWKMDGKKGWTELRVGEVEVPAAAGEHEVWKMEIALLGWAGGHWKRGLTLLGIKISNPRRLRQ